MSDISKLSDNERYILSQLVGYSKSSDNYDRIGSLFVGFFQFIRQRSLSQRITRCLG